MSNLTSIFTENSVFQGVFNLIFPNLCVACGENMPAHFHSFCFSCQTKNTDSGMCWEAENEFTQRLWGRIPFKAAAAHYYFRKQSPIQEAMHKLKYKSRPDIGEKLGRDFGLSLKKSPYFQEIECIVPVPLHPRREKMRGYNQSTHFALGLSSAMDIPTHPRALERVAYTESQTKKSRLERNKNVMGIFRVREPEKLQGKHVLLVDDILTTGATLEHCAAAITELENTRISLAALCIAKI